MHGLLVQIFNQKINQDSLFGSVVEVAGMYKCTSANANKCALLKNISTMYS